MKKIIKKNESWLKNYWRPLMSWQYLIVCLYDFLAAPIIYNHISLKNPEHIVQWNPITLQAGGLYHISMAAIIGVYTWSRGVEKIEMLKKGIYQMNETDKEAEVAAKPVETPSEEPKA